MFKNLVFVLVFLCAVTVGVPHAHAEFPHPSESPNAEAVGGDADPAPTSVKEPAKPAARFKLFNSTDKLMRSYFGGEPASEVESGGAEKPPAEPQTLEQKYAPKF